MKNPLSLAMRSGVSLMRQLHFGTKLMLLVALLIVPGLLYSSQMISGLLQAREQLTLKLAAARWLHQASSVMARPDVDAPALEALATTLPTPHTEVRAVWQSASQRWLVAPGSPQAISEMRLSMLRVAESSGLLFDAEPAVALRVGLELHHLDRLQSHLSADWLAPADGRNILRDELQSLTNALDMLRRAGIAPSAAWDELRRQVLAQADGLDAAGAGRSLQIRASLGAVRHELRDGLVRALETRLSDSTRSLWLWGGGASLGAVLALLLACLVHRSLTGSIGLLQRQLEKLAVGDLSGQIQVHGRDELAQLGALLERTGQRMSALVAEIRTSAVRVGEAGENVAAEGMALARRTDAQCDSLSGSVGSVERLSEAVSDSARMVEQLSQLAERLRSQAQEGQGVMRLAVDEAQALQDSARRVAEINGVIDDLAFQTNLVALNASVEAARAGESGRGFSVVAAEIRQLALRCGEAAGEVRQLIERTGDQVQLSSNRIGEVRLVLDAMAEGVDGMAARLGSLGETGRLHGQELRRVGEEVRGLQAITRENARTVVSAEAASRVMVAQSSALQASVATMQLRHGTADEARELAERAKRRVAEVGWARAADEFSRADGPFVDRDLYIFAFDADGRYLACGATPERVGTRLLDVRGIRTAEAEHLLAEGRRQAAQGGGWVEYDFVGADPSVARRKSAWVLDLGDGAFLGCGVYRQVSASAHAGAGLVPEREAQPA